MAEKKMIFQVPETLPKQLENNEQEHPVYELASKQTLLEPSDDDESVTILVWNVNRLNNETSSVAIRTVAWTLSEFDAIFFVECSAKQTRDLTKGPRKGFGFRSKLLTELKALGTSFYEIPYKDAVCIFKEGRFFRKTNGKKVVGPYVNKANSFCFPLLVRFSGDRYFHFDVAVAHFPSNSSSNPNAKEDRTESFKSLNGDETIHVGDFNVGISPQDNTQAILREIVKEYLSNLQGNYEAAISDGTMIHPTKRSVHDNIFLPTSGPFKFDLAGCGVFCPNYSDINYNEQTSKFEVEERYILQLWLATYSDHWPIQARIVLKNPNDKGILRTELTKIKFGEFSDEEEEYDKEDEFSDEEEESAPAPKGKKGQQKKGKKDEDENKEEQAKPTKEGKKEKQDTVILKKGKPAKENEGSKLKKEGKLKEKN